MKKIDETNEMVEIVTDTLTKGTRDVELFLSVNNIIFADIAKSLAIIADNLSEKTDLKKKEDVIEAIEHAHIDFNIESTINFVEHKREVQEIIDNILKVQKKAIEELYR